MSFKQTIFNYASIEKALEDINLGEEAKFKYVKDYFRRCFAEDFKIDASKDQLKGIRSLFEAMDEQKDTYKIWTMEIYEILVVMFGKEGFGIGEGHELIIGDHSTFDKLIYQEIHENFESLFDPKNVMAEASAVAHVFKIVLIERAKLGMKVVRRALRYYFASKHMKELCTQYCQTYCIVTEEKAFIKENFSDEKQTQGKKRKTSSAQGTSRKKAKIKDPKTESNISKV